MDEWLGPLWNNLGATYDDREEFSQALEAYRKARHYHWKVGDEHAKLVADWAVGKTYRRLQEYETASQWLRPVLAWAERRYAEDPSVERGEWVGLAAWDLGEIAVAQGQPEEAREFLLRATQLLGDADMSEWDAKSWRELTSRAAELQN